MTPGPQNREGTILGPQKMGKGHLEDLKNGEGTTPGPKKWRRNDYRIQRIKKEQLQDPK